jgi:hypothetical protein
VLHSIQEEKEEDDGPKRVAVTRRRLELHHPSMEEKKTIKTHVFYSDVVAEVLKDVFTDYLHALIWWSNDP